MSQIHTIHSIFAKSDKFMESQPSNDNDGCVGSMIRIEQMYKRVDAEMAKTVDSVDGLCAKMDEQNRILKSLIERGRV